MKIMNFMRSCTVIIIIAMILSCGIGFNLVMAQGNLLNGPYLLAPTATGMTVSWETQTPVGAKIFYGMNGQLTNQLDVQCERGAPWKDNPEGICMYRAVLTALTSDTLYNYKVELESGEIQEGTFKTLKENPSELHLFTISDSHGFKMSKVFTDSVLASKPDFILHSGDLPAGTGFQKDSYKTSWFTPGAEFLKNIPVVYINGNHDSGPYFADYFMKAAKDTYNASPNGLNYSFNYGNTHIVMVNSNPWGFDEMNADLSNLPIDKKTTDTIKSSLTWLEQDLQSDGAKNAKWRIVVMHHPYSDNFANKHVISILEKNNANLMLSGHLHFYEKNISIDPAVGAKSLYITQGTPEPYPAVMDYGKPGERILSDYPEVLAMGKATYSTLDITGEKLTFKTYGIPKGETIPRVLDETTLAHEEPNIVLSNVVITPNKADRKTLSFAGTVKNKGNGLAGVTVKMFDNNEEILLNMFGVNGKERLVALNAGEEKNITRNIAINGSGRHVIRIGGTSYTINIPENSAAFELSNMTTRVGQGQDSDVVFTTVEVTNPHKTVRESTVDLYINDIVVQTQKTRLEPNERKIVDFAYRFALGGTYQVKVGNLAAKTVEIEGVLKGTPLVKDLSGYGNDGIIRGNPKITPRNDGTVSVSLVEKDGDYIEIPDSRSLHVKDGFTGIVWANLNRMSKEGEQDRNPIMVKGPSLGWGANYLVRMAVKKANSSISGGTCYNTSEYSWEGGKVPVGEWAQYAMAFNKSTGGTTYLNSKKVAEIAGISQDAELRNWEGHPILIGFSYTGHVIKEFNRPKYFAHFPGEVSQVRFYSSKLSADETKYLNANPGEVGPKAEDLRAWLNFKDIKTEGIHKTEWRKPSEFKATYKADKQLWGFRTLTVGTKIPTGTSLIATVEVSDNASAIKGSKEFILKDGKQTLNISDLPKAQYIRIVTKFSSIAGQDGTYVPELNLYNVIATLEKETTQMNWGTRADWEKGSFEGAIGFEPLNRTKIIEESTDVLH